MPEPQSLEPVKVGNVYENVEAGTLGVVIGVGKYVVTDWGGQETELNYGTFQDYVARNILKRAGFDHAVARNYEAAWRA